MQTNQSKDKLIKNYEQKLTIVGNKNSHIKTFTKLKKIINWIYPATKRELELALKIEMGQFYQLQRFFKKIKRLSYIYILVVNKMDH